MTSGRFERAADAVAAARSHGALELLRAEFRVEFGDDVRRARLDRLIDVRHRLLTRSDALLREVSLCEDGEEAQW